MKIWQEKAEKYLEISGQYRLGGLSTEQPHPKSINLSFLAKNDLPAAIKVLHSIDCDALDILSKKASLLDTLALSVAKTLDAGRNIFLCGCGATGRLSLALETIWRRNHYADNLENRVRGFMAGGDMALVRSVENFEDFPEYGRRQLFDAGFTDGDLLICCTEGGETPFVIGAAETAAETSGNPPYFLYCNPNGPLIASAERSRRVLENDKIIKINLDVGPMALAGSTRMQASTVLMAAAGVCLLNYEKSEKNPATTINSLTEFFKNLDLSFLEPFIIEETETYLNGGYLLYESSDKLAISVLTDTTERSPTFSLVPFENVNENYGRISLCHLCLPKAENAAEAWRMILGRNPQSIEWEDTHGAASMTRLMGYDMSSQCSKRRKEAFPQSRHVKMIISESQSGLKLTIGENSSDVQMENFDSLSRHLVLKMILNTISTLVMGRLGRYEGNLMTWVRAANYKLIDRAVRYTEILLNRKGIKKDYDEIAHYVFEIMETITPDKPVVLTVVEKILQDRQDKCF